MVDQSPRREIKIRITKPEPEGESKPEYVYHWDRIIGAVAALVLVLGLIGYGLHAWLQPSIPLAGPEVGDQRKQAGAGAVPDKQSPATQRAEQITELGPISTSAPRGGVEADGVVGADALATIPESPEMESGDAQPRVQPESEDEGLQPPLTGATDDVGQAVAGERDDLPAEMQAPIGAQPSPRDEILESASMQLPLPADDREAEAGSALATMADEEPRQAAESMLARETRPEPPSPDASMAPVELREEEPAPDTVADRTAQAVNSSDEEGNRGRFRAARSDIASSAVKRFVLARSVEGNEPRGGLDDITPDAKGVVEVSSFSEVTGLEGKVLEYRWLHEGERVLRIRVPVGAERWRSHASKRLYPSMKGDWRVELRDAKGNLLASAEFVYQP
jgi:hypothetical protein